MHQGRIVVVTGAGGGIGERIVDCFLLDRDTVVGLDRSEHSLEALVSSHKKETRLSVVKSDITQANEVAGFAKHMKDTHGRVDLSS